MWLIWAFWSLFLVSKLPLGQIIISVLDSVLVKSAIWILPLLFFRKQLSGKELFRAPFPWLPCLIFICLTVAFLHTVRLLNGLQGSYVFVEAVPIISSIAAGIIEELSFRGGFYNLTEDRIGFWPASLLNGGLFTLFHYPELLLGKWESIVSLRTILIFVMGWIFCWMYKKWRNLALNMTVHSVWNIISYLFCLAG